MQPATKRDRLVDSAAFLFHRKGLSSTSLADIAKHADIPIGNVYYYFKTKDDLAMAALGKHRERFQATYARLEEEPDPRLRLIQAVANYRQDMDAFVSFGCPIGRIVSDGAPENAAIAQLAAQILVDFARWAEQQFRSLGHGSDGKRLAISLISSLQGAILMAKAMADASALEQEIARLTDWLTTLPNRRIHLGKAPSATAAKAEANAA